MALPTASDSHAASLLPTFAPQILSVRIKPQSPLMVKRIVFPTNCRKLLSEKFEKKAPHG